MSSDRSGSDRLVPDRLIPDRLVPDRFGRDDALADAARDDHVDDGPSSSRRTVVTAAAVAAGATALAVLARGYGTYRAERDAAYARVDPDEHRVAHTPVGDVEHRERGSGTPVLVSHGIVGGCDQAMRVGSALVDDARIVAPSRFGYLGSTIPTYPSPSTQARAFAGLLDDRGVDDTVVVGTSAGAPAAIRFALAFPERTRGLVLLAAATPSDRERDGPTGPPTPLLRDPVFWLLRSRAPRLLRRLFGVSRGDWQRAAPADRDRVDALLDTLFPVAPRRAGVAVDADFTNLHVVDHADDYDPADVAVPTLVVHAEDDPLADFSDAARFADRTPNGVLRAYETGGHLVFGHGDDVREHVTAFVRDPDGYVAGTAPRSATS
ncbi:alpha/beta hydrolase [Halorubellus sp. PRR65]|uniref:alpha/beta fold hydrolase n=1 Tax=Halorubellus sp. PRR65 TaxID=3098148 RepID=UPI002B25BF20|nr:alpha/beta hydrolase [Halorubellus sp. PRR65]